MKFYIKAKRILYTLFLITFFNYSDVFADEPIVSCGIDVLEANNFTQLSGKKVYLLCNHTARSRDGRSSVEILRDAPMVNLLGLFTPEHGFYTTVPAGDHVGDDKVMSVPVYSLYGKGRRPDVKRLQQCDAVVIDLQDIGVRSYTYLSTMYKTMDACAEAGVPVVILDRPNPLGGIIVDGGTVRPGKESFVSIIPVSYIHGCTFGELALMINEQGWLPNHRKCLLQVVRMKGWERWMTWEDTGLTWYPTSPHIPTVNAIRGAAMLGPLGELGIISIGIGTTSPFQYLGAPGLNTEKILKEMNGPEHHGIYLTCARYRPFYGMYRGKDVDGFLLAFRQDNLFQPFTMGMRLMMALARNTTIFDKMLKERSEQMFGKVTGGSNLLALLKRKAGDQDFLAEVNKGRVEYTTNIRSRYLLY